jgi:serine/threonine-protein kinase RsbW
MTQETFPAHLDSLYEMLNFIQKIGQSYDVEPHILEKIILAVEEALVNIISYSYPDHPGTIEIDCAISQSPAQMRIHVQDKGVPFDPVDKHANLAALTEPTNIEQVKLGGYGIYIFVGVMDHVEYQRVDGGNFLNLVKYL